MVLVVLLRMALGAVGWALNSFAPQPQLTGGEWAQATYPAGSILAAMVQPWNRWDAFWFEHVATAGYSAGGPEAAFFPVWPALLAGAGRLMGGHYAIAGLGLNTLFTVAGLYLLYRLVAHDFDRPTAQRTVAFMALAPPAFFFLAPYSEALFLCLTVGAFLSARRKRWAIVGCCGLLAALTRPAGVLLFLPLLVEVVIEATERRRAGQWPFRPGHLAVFAPLVGLAAWEIYVRTALAIPDGVAGAARYWGQHPALPWQALADSVRSAVSGSPEEWLNLAAVLGVVATVVLGWRRLPRSYTIYAAAMLVPMTFREAATAPLTSDARYALMVFPLFVVVAIITQHRWAQVAVATVSVPLLVGLFVLYAAYDFLG